MFVKKFFSVLVYFCSKFLRNSMCNRPPDFTEALDSFDLKIILNLRKKSAVELGFFGKCIKILKFNNLKQAHTNTIYNTFENNYCLIFLFPTESDSDEKPKKTRRHFLHKYAKGHYCENCCSEKFLELFRQKSLILLKKEL